MVEGATEATGAMTSWTYMGRGTPASSNGIITLSMGSGAFMRNGTRGSGTTVRLVSVRNNGVATPRVTPWHKGG